MNINLNKLLALAVSLASLWTFSTSAQTPNAFAGTNLLETARVGSDRPKLFAVMDAGATSAVSNEITLNFALRVVGPGALQGIFSLYPRDVGADADIGQIGFFGDGRIGIIDTAGANWQFLTNTLLAGVWNPVVIKYINGSGNWSVSVNGGAFESRTGMGSDGGIFGGNFQGFKTMMDADGTGYSDAYVLSNKTANVVLFSDSFEKGVAGAPPVTDTPTVGTYSSIVVPGLLIRTDSVPPPDHTDNIFADNFDSSTRQTNTLVFNAFAGTNLLETARVGSDRPKMFAVMDAGATSAAGDEISLNLAVRVNGGVFSVYPRDVELTPPPSGEADIGQIGFFADGKVGIVDDTGNFFNFLTNKINAGVWNQVVIKYVNGSGNWCVSVNGGPFECRTGKGSDGGFFGGNFQGFKTLMDAGGTAFSDAYVLSNRTANAVLFSDSFEKGVPGGPPVTDTPTVGTYSGIVLPGEFIRNGITNGIVVNAPPNAPQTGTYTYDPTSALVVTDTSHSPAKSVYLYPIVSQDTMRPVFTTLVTSGIKLHVEAWFNWIAGQVQWGLDAEGDSQFAMVSLREGGSVTVFNGTNEVDSGLTHAFGGWEEFALDYVVGATNITLTVNGASAVMAVPSRSKIKGLWFTAALFPTDDPQSRAYVDDVLASVPHLFFTRNGNQLTLSWDAAGYVLQENSNLSNPNGWVNVIGGGTSPVVVPAGGAPKFYRLKNP